MRLFMLLLLLTSAPALAADQFNLACQGTRLSQRDGTAEPYSFQVKVDLTKQKWCMDKCEQALDIYEVKPDSISLADDITYNTRSDFSNAVKLDRKTLDFHQLATQDRPSVTYLKVEAKCTEQPFTPFTDAK